MKSTYDVIVVGGGPAGSAAANILSKSGRKTIIIDSENFQQRKVGETLSLAALPLLKKLNLMRLVNDGPHIFSGTGWHLDRVRFDSELRKAALENGCDYFAGSVETIKDKKTHWVVNTSEGAQLVANWIIDASGRSASVARGFGATRLIEDNLMAIYAWTQPDLDNRDSRTVTEITSYGSWYTSRLPDDSRIVVFYTDSSHVAEIVRSPFAWQRHLNDSEKIRHVLKGCPLVSELKVADVSIGKLDRFVGRRWLATGDAAMTFDPRTGQGIFNSLYTGIKAGESVLSALNGDVVAIAEYVDSVNRIRKEVRVTPSSPTQRMWL